MYTYLQYPALQSALAVQSTGQRRTHSSTTATERWPGGADRQQQGKQANRGGTARSVTLLVPRERERGGGGIRNSAIIGPGAAKAPGPFVTRRRWSSLSSFPGKGRRVSGSVVVFAIQIQGVVQGTTRQPRPEGMVRRRFQ